MGLLSQAGRGPYPYAEIARGRTGIGKIDVNAHRVQLDSPELTVEPGEEATCTVRITNTGDVVDAFDIEVLGGAAGWTVVEPATVSLFPGAEGSARLTFRPARSPNVPAGPTPFAVRVRSQDAGMQTSVVEEGTLEVGRYAELAADLLPRTSHGHLAGRHRVEVTNRGNAPAAVALRGADAEQALKLVFAPRTLQVPPGASGTASLKARCARPALAGGPQRWSFQVTAETEGTAPVELQGVMEQRPLTTRWSRRALAFAAIALVGLAVYSAKGQELKSVAVAVLSSSRPAPASSDGPGRAVDGSSPAASSTPGGGAASSPSPSPSPSPTPGTGTGASGGTTGGATGSSGSSTKPPPAAPATVIGSSSVAPGNFNSVRVLCPSGTQAISGGIDPANVLTVKVTSSAPVYADNNNRLIFRSDGANPGAVGWQVTAKNDDSGPQTIRAAVVCAGAYIGSTSTVVATSNLFGGGNFSVASATCPAGSVALGGGVDLDNVLTMAATSSAPTYRGTRLLSTPSGRNPAPDGWQASARNDSSTSMKFKVAVICSTGVAGRTTSMVTSSSPFASPGSFAAVRVLCPSGAATVGGGIDVGNVLRMTVTSSAPVFPGTNARTLTRSDGSDQAPDGWQVSARNDDSVAEPVTVAVICTTP
jgi:hypothetical protein